MYFGKIITRRFPTLREQNMTEDRTSQKARKFILPHQNILMRVSSEEFIKFSRTRSRMDGEDDMA